MCVCEFGESTDVAQRGQWVGGRLHEQHLGLGQDGRLPGRQVVQIDIAGADAEARQVFVEQHHGTAENAARTDQVIALLQQAHTGRQDGGHAGCGCHAGLSALHGCQPFFEGAHRRVGEARVDIARLLAAETCRRLGRRAEHEARGHEDGFGVFVFGAAFMSDANRPRGQLPLGIEITHYGYPRSPAWPYTWLYTPRMSLPAAASRCALASSLR